MTPGAQKTAKRSGLRCQSAFLTRSNTRTRSRRSPASSSYSLYYSFSRLRTGTTKQRGYLFPFLFSMRLPLPFWLSGGEERNVRTHRSVDSAGNLDQRTDARGLVTKYIYDALNRLTDLDHYESDGETLVDSMDYTYDAVGVQTCFLYDGLGSTTDLTDGSANVVDGYTYDVFGAIRSQSGSSDN